MFNWVLSREANRRRDKLKRESNLESASCVFISLNVRELFKYSEDVSYTSEKNREVMESGPICMSSSTGTIFKFACKERWALLRAVVGHLRIMGLGP